MFEFSANGKSQIAPVTAWDGWGRGIRLDDFAAAELPNLKLRLLPA